MLPYLISLMYSHVGILAGPAFFGILALVSVVIAIACGRCPVSVNKPFGDAAMPFAAMDKRGSGDDDFPDAALSKGAGRDNTVFEDATSETDCDCADTDCDDAYGNEKEADTDCDEVDSIDGDAIADDALIEDPFDAGDMDYVDWLAAKDQCLASDPDCGEGDDSDTDLSDKDSDNDGETGRLRVSAHDRHVPPLEPFCDSADTSWQAAIKTGFSDFSEQADLAVFTDIADTEADMRLKQHAFGHEQIDRSHGMMQPSMHCPFCNLRKLGEA